MLDIQDLTVAYRHGNGYINAVNNFSLQVSPGQTYGLVGESGSGKTTVALAVMRYLSGSGQVRGGQIEFDGQDLLALTTAEMRQVWGRQLSLVPQDPLSSLNPAIRLGEQLAEPLRHHLGLAPDEAAARAVALLHMVRVPDPARVARAYPHEISGGMQQRVLIALALSTEPKLLVLDEPTTSLDVTTQAAVLDLFRDLIRERQTAVLYVTHNLGVVARICDRVAVLYAGELVEDAPTTTLYHQPLHPYTQGLLNSVPQLGQIKTGVPLQAIPGQIAALAERHTGCVFAPRCALAVEKCAVERPSLESAASGHLVRCHRWSEIAAGEIAIEQTGATPITDDRNTEEDIVLAVQDVKVHFGVNRSLLETVTGQPTRSVKAVDGIDLTIRRGRTLGLVGESGSGKTTLARAIIGLVGRTGGAIDLLDLSLPAKLSQRNLDTLRQLQYVFQDPEEALNPYLTIGETLKLLFITLLGQNQAEAAAGAVKLLAAVGLPADYMQRLPSQLSGGEKQRIAIARAFATDPDLLLADEPVSSLDVSVQASILNLLGELQVENDSTMLFISHDLAVVGYLADQIAVIYVGHLMEVADAASLFEPPYHPYTEALLSAIPLTDPLAKQQIIRLAGDVPSQINVPSGCPFHPRCPRYLGDICRDQQPPWQKAGPEKQIFCHIPLADLQRQQERVFHIEGDR